MKVIEIIDQMLLEKRQRIEDEQGRVDRAPDYHHQFIHKRHIELLNDDIIRLTNLRNEIEPTKEAL